MDSAGSELDRQQALRSDGRLAGRQAPPQQHHQVKSLPVKGDGLLRMLGQTALQDAEEAVLVANEHTVLQSSVQHVMRHTSQDKRACGGRSSARRSWPGCTPGRPGNCPSWPTSTSCFAELSATRHASHEPGQACLWKGISCSP